MKTKSTLKPDLSAHFPAKRITSCLTWDDLILAPDVMMQVQEVNLWMRHGRALLGEWNLGQRTSPGYKAFFHGPPGTGKTMTACLLGQSQGMDVYRVDLPQVISKYLDETAKNLADVFNQAADKNWILYFDKADALFGRRTHTEQANERYANLETSFLLQRIEAYPGVVILAAHSSANIDSVFLRRLQSCIHFAPPDRTLRRRLWERAFTPPLELEPAVQLEYLAREYEVTGGQIVNAVRYSVLKAIERGPRVIRLEDVCFGLKLELEKDGRAG
ncbi:ATP-binding protein [Prosthecobacter sp.]|uniref:ATP-binding protein n=1 Tax=Prosthecobacter sp. TaxID=1965333 RepID=UPI003783D74A